MEAGAGVEGRPMDIRLLEAATSGNATAMRHMALEDPGVLLGTTPQGNTCLHVSSIHGHEGFCREALNLNCSLLSAVNEDKETPLLTAVTSGHAPLASFFLRCYCDLQWSEYILQEDQHGCNVLHHAIRNGHRELALELIAVEPSLSCSVNKNDESPMFLAAMRNYAEVCDKLLEIPYSSHIGTYGFNPLHAAVRNGNLVIAKRIMETRPVMAKEEDCYPASPIHMAALENKTDMTKALLEHDRYLGYHRSTLGVPLLCFAASGGHVGVARELLKHCPDAPYRDTAKGWTCLHLAVLGGHTDFAEFVLGSPQLRKLVNMLDEKGQTALHIAAKNNMPNLVAALLHHQDINVAVVDKKGLQPTWNLPHASYHDHPLNWMIARASGSSGALMDRRLLEAATSGDAALMRQLALPDPNVLLATNEQGNTCLHISSIHGDESFCKDALELNPSLLTAVNLDGETPLLTAVTNGHVSIASVLLRYCRNRQLSKAILKQDKNGCNTLHHAIRCGHKCLALELIAAEPALSSAVNENRESPLFIAAMRDFNEVSERLLEIPDSAHGGACGYNALHAAVRNGNEDIARRIMETRPGLAREENMFLATPVHAAALENKIGVLREMLEHDLSLGYLTATSGATPLCSAAAAGQIGAAEVLLKYCPDAPYYDNTTGWTCLHLAVNNGHTQFVHFILRSPLGKVINLPDKEGQTALHFAVRKCNPEMVAALLHHHQRIDVTMLNKFGQTASWVLSGVTNYAKTLNWNTVSKLLLEANPKYKTSVSNLHQRMKDKVTDESRREIKALTQTYTNYTSLVAILIATITFAAAFTLPGGYSTDTADKGHPILARELAFQAFVITDTMAMCSSLAVAFLCILTRWEDLEFLRYYISLTRILMWFAYMTTTIAFATGLYTVLAPRLLWLATAICILSVLFPILAWLLSEWPVLKLRIQLGKTSKLDLLDMV
ncbi:hypothetical protein ACP70R_045203 [Stipagrostis hirtigluma subsp. patula]